MRALASKAQRLLPETKKKKERMRSVFRARGPFRGTMNRALFPSVYLFVPGC